MKTLTLGLRIGGMTCGSCSASIEAALKRCKEISVEEAIVYWETGEAKIRVSIRLSDEANNIRSLVCETVENAGFDVLEEFEETEAGVIKEKLVRAATITTSTTSSSSLSSEFPLLQFTIDGMTCSSCVESVQNCLRTLPGIQLLQVTLLPVGSATVKLLDPSLIDAGDIKEAIEDAGFLVISTSSAVVEPVVAKTSEGTSGGGVVDAAEASTAHHIITKPVATNHHLPSSTGGSSSSSDSLIDFGVHSSNNNSSLVHRPLTPEINTLLSSTSLSSRTAAFKEGGAAAVAVAVLAVDGMTCNSCVRLITGALQDIHGVKQAIVSLQAKSAQIYYSSTEIPMAASNLFIDTISSLAGGSKFSAAVVSVPSSSLLFGGGNGLDSNENQNRNSDRFSLLSSIPLQLVAPIPTNSNNNAPSSSIYNNMTPITSTFAYPPPSQRQQSHIPPQRSNLPRLLPKRTPSRLASSSSNTTLSAAANATSASNLVHLRVQGMTCASCVATIERHLRVQPGILACKVGLLAERAEVEINPSILTDPNVVADMINEIGFEASLVVADELGLVVLTIEGMRGNEQAARDIENNCLMIPGIESAEVDVLNKTGRFSFVKSARVGIRGIVEAIEHLGYTAIQSTADDDPSRPNAQIESLARTKEIMSWRNTFYNCLICALPVSFISMVLPMIAPAVGDYSLIPGLSLSNLAMLFLTIPIQFRIGKRFHVAAWKALSHGSSTMDVLISLGTNISFFFSCLSLFYAICSAGAEHHPTVFFETSTNLITFISLGRWLENSAKGKTSSALSKLISLAPSHAVILEAPTMAPAPVTASPSSSKSRQNSNNNNNLLPSLLPISSLVEKRIPADYIQVGDLLKVMPGERIPADGVIEFGATSVDEALVTGEPLPVKKQVSDSVIGGTVNGTGLIHVRAMRVGQDTTLAQIVKLVSNAQTEKAPIQYIADTIAGYFVPAVVLLAAITFLVWLVLLSCMSEHMSAWSFPVKLYPQSLFSRFFVALNFSIAVIVVACPCALGLATPTAVMVGTGVGAELGILIKGGAGLEIGRKINKLIFDKTGTLTLGTLVVVNHELFSDRLDVSTSTTAVMMGGDAGGGGPGFVDLTSELFFAICAAAESGSEHPLGRSIVQHARKVLQLEGGGEEKNGGGGDGGRVLDVSAELPFELIQFTALPGSGIRAVVGPFEYEKKTPLTLPRNKPVSVMLGNPDFLIEGNITVPAALVKSKRIHEAQGHTVVAVAINNACVGFIALADAIKPEAPMAVRALEAIGIQVVMVTGDQEATARVIAEKCGIKEVYAGVSPSGKKRIVAELQGKQVAGRVSMVRNSRTRLIGGGSNDDFIGMEGGNGSSSSSSGTQRFYVAMVGDGINDSASIAQADLGIAVYGGTDVAVEAASVVLMRPDLMDVVTAIDLSKHIFSRIRYNFLFSIIYNVFMIPFAMGIFSPVGFSLAPMWSGMVMSLSSVSVVVNSLMLKRYKRPGVFGVGSGLGGGSGGGVVGLLGRRINNNTSYAPLMGSGGGGGEDDFDSPIVVDRGYQEIRQQSFT